MRRSFRGVAGGSRLSRLPSAPASLATRRRPGTAPAPGAGSPAARPRRRWARRCRGPSPAVSFLLPRRWGNIRVLRPLGPPLLHLVRLVRRRVQLDQPVEGFGQAPLVHRPLPLLHALVALQEQRLGLGVLLLAQERPAEQRLGVELPPPVSWRLRPGSHALPEIRLRFGPFLLRQIGPAEPG